ncbi:MAG: hypothetical protein L0387_19720 [Acidobacteria bacterium]|nr:hypothetical protein [Acidobacteriota bacterium]
MKRKRGTTDRNKAGTRVLDWNKCDYTFTLLTDESIKLLREYVRSLPISNPNQLNRLPRYLEKENAIEVLSLEELQKRLVEALKANQTFAHECALEQDSELKEYEFGVLKSGSSAQDPRLLHVCLSLVHTDPEKEGVIIEEVVARTGPSSFLFWQSD